MKTLSIIATSILGILPIASALTLDDAKYSGSGSNVKETVTFNEVPFGEATLTFTIDAAALGAAANKYNGQSVVLGYATADIVATDPNAPYITFAVFARFEDNYVYFDTEYKSGGDLPAAPTTGGTGYTVDAISQQDNMAFTLWGLSPVSIRLEYKWAGWLPPSNGFSTYLCGWKNVVIDDFDGIAFSELHLNTEFVNSYYVFDTAAASDAEARNINKAAAEAAPAIPEPATATLSLLALATLASRRRRY